MLACDLQALNLCRKVWLVNKYGMTALTKLSSQNRLRLLPQLPSAACPALDDLVNPLPALCASANLVVVEKMGAGTTSRRGRFRDAAAAAWRTHPCRRRMEEMADDRVITPREREHTHIRTVRVPDHIRTNGRQ